MRKRTTYALLAAGAILLAGCSGTDDTTSTDTTPTTTDPNVRAATIALETPPATTLQPPATTEQLAIEPESPTAEADAAGSGAAVRAKFQASGGCDSVEEYRASVEQGLADFGTPTEVTTDDAVDSMIESMAESRSMISDDEYDTTVQLLNSCR